MAQLPRARRVSVALVLLSSLLELASPASRFISVISSVAARVCDTAHSHNALSMGVKPEPAVRFIEGGEHSVAMAIGQCISGGSGSIGNGIADCTSGVSASASGGEKEGNAVEGGPVTVTAVSTVSVNK